MKRSNTQNQHGDNLLRAFLNARKAVGFLEAHRLEPSVGHYRMALAYMVDPGSPVALEIDALIDGGIRLSSQDAADLACRLSPEVGASAHDTLAGQANRLTRTAFDTLAATSAFKDDITPLAASDAVFSAVASLMLARAAEAEHELAKSIHELEQVRAELKLARTDAHHDPLTGLLNRRGAEAALRQIENTGRYAVALCDVDRFKAINDRYGHAVGDNVLRAIAATLRETCANMVVARWGGEELLVAAADVDALGMRAVIDCARIALTARTFRLRDSGEPITAVTFSAGCAEQGAGDIMAAIVRADELCYLAKGAGRDCVVCQ